MAKVARIALILLMVIVCIATSYIAASRTRLVPQPYQVPAEYMPGSMFTCSGFDVDSQRYTWLPCYIYYVDNKEIIIVSDTKSWVVKSTLITASLNSLGDYIAAWGYPSQVYDFPDSKLSKIYFGSYKSVWIIRPFSPDEKVFYEEYYREPSQDTLRDWKGFSAS